MNERLKALDYVFHPRSIAFIGATERLGKWGFIVFNNLITGGYGGRLYPVNPGRSEVLGLKAYPSVRAVPEAVDLAVFTVPAEEVPAALDDCVAAGVKGAVIISAGFREVGGKWAEVEAEMVRKAQAAGMVVVGPNGQGVCCPAERLYAWMPVYFYPPSGPVAVISQSGNVQGLLVDTVIKAGFGVSKGVSSGNEADLTSADYIEYLAEDPDTEVILTYVEGVTAGRRFIEVCRQVSRRKPIVLLKGGRTPAGFSAARSHTGALAVSSELFDAACEQAGVIRVSALNSAGLIAASFLNRPLPPGRRVGIITGGGGLGVIAADRCAELGLTVAQLSPGTVEKIQKMMPSWWVPGNPIDLVAGMNFHVVMPIIDLLMKSGEIDALLLLFIGPPRNRQPSPPALNKPSEQLSKVWETMGRMYKVFYEALYQKMHEFQLPLYVVSNFEENSEFNPAEIPVERRLAFFPAIETACQAIQAMACYHEFKQKPAA